MANEPARAFETVGLLESERLSVCTCLLETVRTLKTVCLLETVGILNTAFNGDSARK